MLNQGCLLSAGRQSSAFLPHRPQARLRLQPCQSRTGRAAEPFNEGAAQVKRLIQRDRQEFLGNEEDILDKYRQEFGPSRTNSTAEQEQAQSASPSSASTSSAAPATAGASQATPSSSGRSAPAPSPVKTSFSAPAPTASPFGPVNISKRTSIEPAGLRPDMAPDPIAKPTPLVGNWLTRITITQVVLFCTFSSMIGLMLATFYVVIKAGGVRLAGLD